MDSIIKNLIESHKTATVNIDNLEDFITNYKVNTEANKVEFANYCILLKGTRLIKEATECLLSNNGFVVTDSGEYYQKVDSIYNHKSEPCTGTNKEE